MYETIKESKRDLEDEKQDTQRAFGREREQMNQLQMLGLSEVEAVEYLLMVSRDEEERRMGSPSNAVEENGVFEEDFEGVQNPSPLSSSFSGSSRRSSGSSAYHGSTPGWHSPRMSPSNSNAKIMVSARVRTEPLEAGTSASASPPNRLVEERNSLPLLDDVSSFPAVTGATAPGTSRSWPGRASSGSAQSIKSAWTTPIKFPARAGHVSLAEDAGPSRSAPRVPAALKEEVDEDLELAIALSLAEAKSRGDIV